MFFTSSQQRGGFVMSRSSCEIHNFRAVLAKRFGIYESGSRIPTPPPQWYGPPPPPIPHTFCARHCNETYISIFLHARRCSETHIFILLDEPSRRIRWVVRAKLWRNANFKLQELLRAVYRTFQCSANGIIYIYTYTGTYPYTYIYIKIYNYIINIYIYIYW